MGDPSTEGSLSPKSHRLYSHDGIVVKIIRRLSDHAGREPRLILRPHRATEYLGARVRILAAIYFVPLLSRPWQTVRQLSPAVAGWR